MRRIEVTIIPQRCKGCPYCEEAFPELFKVNKVVTLASGEHRAYLPIEYLPKVQRAFFSCPNGGISYRLVV